MVIQPMDTAMALLLTECNAHSSYLNHSLGLHSAAFNLLITFDTLGALLNEAGPQKAVGHLRSRHCHSNIFCHIIHCISISVGRLKGGQVKGAFNMRDRGLAGPACLRHTTKLRLTS